MNDSDFLHTYQREIYTALLNEFNLELLYWQFCQVKVNDIFDKVFRHSASFLR